MLLPESIHPYSTLYYNGAAVLRAARALKESSFFDLYAETRRTTQISMPIFILSLDWLYLARCIRRNKKGNFVVCS